MIRILSDLHFRHPAGFVRDLGQIAPLLEGVERVIFNGDSVEARFVSERNQGHRDADAIIDFCRSAGVEPTLLTGNHDPLVTSEHHVDLAEGAVLVTHGDLLFQGLTPWSRETTTLISAHDRALEEAGHPTTLEGQLLALRKAALAVECMGPRPHHEAQVKTIAGFLRQVWPPGRVLRMLDSWWRTPDFAAAVAREYRPEADFVLIGHTHRAGVWQRGGKRVINTGAFLPWAGLLCVDLSGEEVTVRHVQERSGCFHPGSIKWQGRIRCPQ